MNIPFESWSKPEQETAQRIVEEHYGTFTGKWARVWWKIMGGQVGKPEPSNLRNRIIHL